MGDGCTAAACRTSPLVWRPTANGSGSQLFRRDRLHGPHLHPLAAAARPRAWLRVTCDGMAPVERVGHGGPVRAAPLEVLDRLGLADRLDWSRASVDSASVRAKRGGPCWRKSGRPRQAWEQDPSRLRGEWAAADRRGDGGQHHRRGHLVAVLDDLPAVLTPAGRRRTRPGKLDADKGYDSASNRAYLRRRGIRPRIARRGIESSQRLGRHRWRVERALSWLSCYRRLQVRWDRGSERFFAFVLLACALVCFKRL
jgi:hypothetical protein